MENNMFISLECDAVCRPTFVGLYNYSIADDVCRYVVIQAHPIIIYSCPGMFTERQIIRK